MKTWLKNASDRDGGRKQREAKRRGMYDNLFVFHYEVEYNIYIS
jgi:hypothetical protein